jgi:hypothetical protein
MDVISFKLDVELLPAGRQHLKRCTQMDVNHDPQFGPATYIRTEILREGVSYGWPKGFAGSSRGAFNWFKYKVIMPVVAMAI